MSFLKFRLLAFFLSSLGLIILNACGGGGSSSSFPGTVQLAVQVSGSGTVSSNPAGINCGQTCTASFNSGAQVTLTAAAAANSTFTSWGGACSGTKPTCTVTLSANQNVTATFTSAQPTLTVSSAGTGTGTVSSAPAGITCPGTCSASFPSGTQVTLTAAASAGSTFAGWSGAGCSGTSTCTINLTASQSAVATFNVVQVLPTLSVSVVGSGATGSTVTSLPAGINCPTTCTAGFAVGTQVTLSAYPSPAALFSGWSVSSCGATQTCTVTIGATNVPITATFIEPTLSVTIAGSAGNSTVGSSPGGISCPTACSANFGIGTQVVLSETTAAGFYFVGWSATGCGSNPTCTVPITPNANLQVTATFASFPVLSVTLAGNGTGTVTSPPPPPQISCPGTCSAGFASGSQVTLTETPAANSTFTGWSGACSGTNSTCTVTMNGPQPVTATFTGPQNINAINHIIFLAQENRSFDHYFGALRAYWAANGYPDQSFNGLPQFNPTSGPPPLYGPPPSIPGCDPAFPPPASCNYDPKNPVTSYPLVTECIENPSPSWDEAHADWNYHDEVGKYGITNFKGDGFVKTAGGDARADSFYDVNGIRAMGYYDGNSLNYYYFMASNFGTSDNWFHPVMTRTHPNREYLVAATSQGYVYPIGTDSQDQNLLTATTIFQELQAAGISWRIYVDPTNSNCSGPPYDPNCLINLSYIQFFKWGHTIAANYPTSIAPISQYSTDLATGNLPQVVQIEPATDAGFDEHPSVSDASANNIQNGQNFVAGLINELMSSSYWKDSAFILTWDENGGLYDHVAPVQTVSPDGIPPVDMLPGDVCNANGDSGDLLCDFKVTGYRIPLLVVSPYSNKNYVSHTAADTTAILKLIETRFNLSNLTQRDAAQPDMTEFFDFTNPPWMTPPTPPKPNRNGQCYLNKLP